MIKLICTVIIFICLFIFTVNKIFKLTGGVKTTYIDPNQAVDEISDILMIYVNNKAKAEAMYNELLKDDSFKSICYNVARKFVEDSGCDESVVLGVSEAVVAAYTNDIRIICIGKMDAGSYNTIFNIMLNGDPDYILRVLNINKRSPTFKGYEKIYNDVELFKKVVHVFEDCIYFPEIEFGSHTIQRNKFSKDLASTSWFISKKYMKTTFDFMKMPGVLDEYALAMVNIIDTTRKNNLCVYDWKIFNFCIYAEDGEATEGDIIIPQPKDLSNVVIRPTIQIETPPSTPEEDETSQLMSGGSEKIFKRFVLTDCDLVSADDASSLIGSHINMIALMPAIDADINPLTNMNVKTKKQVDPTEIRRKIDIAIMLKELYSIGSAETYGHYINKVRTYEDKCETIKQWFIERMGTWKHDEVNKFINNWLKL